MLKPAEVIETYWLDHRYMLLEIASFMDRYDAAVKSAGASAENEQKLAVLKQAMQQLVDEPAEEGRAAKLLELFATV